MLLTINSAIEIGLFTVVRGNVQPLFTQRLLALNALICLRFSSQPLHCRSAAFSFRFFSLLHQEQRKNVALHQITPDPVTHFTDNIRVIDITFFESVRYATASGPPTEAKGK